MDLKQFEDNINKKFQDFEPEVDSLKIWDNLEQKLPRKSRKLIYFWWVGLLILPFAFYFIFQNQNESDKVTSNLALKESMNTGVSSIPTISKEQLLFDKDELYSEKKDSMHELVSTQKENFTSQDNDKPKLYSDQSKYVEAVKTFTKVANDGIENERIENERIENDDVFNNSIEKNTLANDDRITTISTLNDVKAESSSIINEGSDDSNEIEENELTIKIFEEEDQIVSMPTRKEFESEDSVEISEKIFDVNKDQTLNSTQPENIVNELSSANKKSLVNERLSFNLKGGVLTSKRIYERVSEEHEQTLNRKIDAEKQLETWQIDGQLKYQISSKIAIAAGLRYWRLSERSSHLANVYFQEQEDVVSLITFHPDGSITESTSTVIFEYANQTNNIRYQVHQAWSIPIQFYYSILNKQKWDLIFSPGFELGFAGRHKGYETIERFEEYLIEEDKDNQYKNTGGNYLLLNLESNYKLNNSLTLIAGLEGKFGLNGFNTETASYKKKYNFLGLFAGLNYSF